VYASRSYRWGRRITAPLRWARSLVGTAPPAHDADAASPATPASDPSPARPQRPARYAKPAYRVLPLRSAGETQPAPQTVAVHLHVHYTDLLPELLDDVAQIPGEFDLFVTTTQPAAAV